MKCCGEEMQKVPREDMAGIFWICYECMTVRCPEDPVREIGR